MFHPFPSTCRTILEHGRTAAGGHARVIITTTKCTLHRWTSNGICRCREFILKSSFRCNIRYHTLRNLDNAHHSCFLVFIELFPTSVRYFGMLKARSSHNHYGRS